jgi:amino-acid N-acetyltransferase
VLRRGDRSQAARLHRLISTSAEEGQLLPRSLANVRAHADRFAVALRGRTIVGCADLAPLGPLVAEVRSLVVAPGERGADVGTSLLEELRRRAQRAGCEKLCVFTHAPGYFMPRGFSIVPHLWLPEKIFTDCASCARFRRCGKYAMVASLEDIDERVEESGREIRDRAAGSVPPP